MFLVVNSSQIGNPSSLYLGINRCDFVLFFYYISADALVSTGLAALGYKYVNIGQHPHIICLVNLVLNELFSCYILMKTKKADDCWAERNRDSSGNLIANSSTFPSGIKALADYVHARGLQLGIYSDAG